MNVTFIFVVSNLASLFIGWVLGRTGRNAAKAAAAASGKTEDPEEVRMRPFRWIVIAVLVVCGVTAANGVYISMGQAKQADCVTEQFNKLIDALDARATDSRKATLQLDKVMRTIVSAYETPNAQAAVDVQNAILGYVTARDEAEETLRQNPYPEPPRDACRE